MQVQGFCVCVFNIEGESGKIRDNLICIWHYKTEGSSLIYIMAELLLLCIILIQKLIFSLGNFGFVPRMELPKLVLFLQNYFIWMLILLYRNAEQVSQLSCPSYLISTAALAEVSRASVIHILQTRNMGTESGGGWRTCSGSQNRTRKRIFQSRPGSVQTLQFQCLK